MNKNFVRFTAALLTLVMVAGCATNGGYNAQTNSCPTIGPNTGLGALGGAAMGAGVGAAATSDGKAVLIGALVGAVVGAIAANVVDAHDCEKAKEAFNKMAKAKTGSPIAWSNPSTGNHGTFTPVTKPKMVDGKVCREFERVIYKSDGTEAVDNKGTTCRTDNGDWETVS